MIRTVSARQIYMIRSRLLRVSSMASDEDSPISSRIALTTGWAAPASGLDVRNAALSGSMAGERPKPPATATI